MPSAGCARTSHSRRHVDPDGDADAWIYTHYRRFERAERLIARLEALGFKILEVWSAAPRLGSRAHVTGLSARWQMVEDCDLAVYMDDNPVVVRVVALKTDTASETQSDSAPSN